MALGGASACDAGYDLHGPSDADEGSVATIADEEFERQVERGARFTHEAVEATSRRLTAAEGALYGLVEALSEAGVVDREDLQRRARAIRGEMDAAGRRVEPSVNLREDEDDEPQVAEVDCAARLHICKAVCCRLRFALSAEEVEAGHVRWDLGQPYEIRHRPEGGCVHLDQALGCQVYEHRPRVCRSYSCAGDKRIWTDFEGMVLNEEWIQANVYGPQAGGRRVAALETRPADGGRSPD